MKVNKTFGEAIWPALVAAFVLAISTAAIASESGPESAGLQILKATADVSRALVVLWAGWLVYSRNGGGTLRAGLGGVLVLFIDHPLVSSLIFILMAVIGESSNTPIAIWGAVLSFVLLSPIAFILGIVGGLAAKFVARRHDAA